jgi:hypothetical protein
MICRNCGFNNAPGDAFCGNCGRFLEWEGDAAAPPTDETSVQPAVPPPPPPIEPPPPIGPPPRPPGPPQMARPVGGGPSPGAIVCWNCGRSNPPSRSFCQQCGERLTVSSLDDDQPRPAPLADGGRRSLAIVIALLALLVLGGGAAAVLMFGSGPSPSATPTDIAALTSSPETPTPPVTGSPPPTDLPTDTPSPTPTAEEPTTPPPAQPSCADSTVPTAWLNLSGANTEERVRRGEAWCIHVVYMVPDPNFGFGRIRLRMDGEVIHQQEHHAGSAETEYQQLFDEPVFVPPRTTVEYRMRCDTDFCNAVIQVGYEQIRVP